MLSGLPDPRQPRGVRHGVGAVLAVTVFAVLAGARNFREAGDRAADLPQELLKLAGCRRHPATARYVAPSEPTIRRIAHTIDAAAADEQVCAWLRRQAEAAKTRDGITDGEQDLIGVAMDGKTVRNSATPGAVDGSEVTLFSAMLHSEAIVIAQLRVSEGTNEITQVSALLADIDLAHVVLTGDAAHAQHSTAAHITDERGGNYALTALTVKGNQPGLLAQIATSLPAAAPGTEHHLDDEGGHGTIVHRAVWTAPAADIDFPGAAQVFRIRRDTYDHQHQRLSKDIVHGITNLNVEQANPAQIARLIRQHWGIENKIHWVRDTTWREDDQHAYAGSGAHTMATLRNLGLGLLRLAGITTIKRTLERIAGDRTRILPIVETAVKT